ncbi:MAG: hypothetical protein ACOCVQ_04420, partial [Bacillota bacterium]
WVLIPPLDAPSRRDCSRASGFARMIVRLVVPPVGWALSFGDLVLPFGGSSGMAFRHSLSIGEDGSSRASGRARA